MARLAREVAASAVPAAAEGSLRELERDETPGGLGRHERCAHDLRTRPAAVEVADRELRRVNQSVGGILQSKERLTGAPVQDPQHAPGARAGKGSEHDGRREHVRVVVEIEVGDRRRRVYGGPGGERFGTLARPTALLGWQERADLDVALTFGIARHVGRHPVRRAGAVVAIAVAPAVVVGAAGSEVGDTHHGRVTALSLAATFGAARDASIARSSRIG